MPVDKKHIDKLESTIKILEEELKLRQDCRSEFAEHLRNCNGELFRLKTALKSATMCDCGKKLSLGTCSNCDNDE